MRIAILLAAVGLVWPSFARSQSPSSSTDCQQDVIRIVRLEKLDGGWDLNFIDKAKVIKQGPYKGDGQNTGFTSVQYRVRKQVIALPEVRVNSCDRTALMSTFYFVPASVLGIKKDDRVFAYIAFGTLVRGPKLNSGGIGASMNVIFYDMHKTGKFDAVQIAAPFGLPFVPGWVK
jgi:hypothetical protein